MGTNVAAQWHELITQQRLTQKPSLFTTDFVLKAAKSLIVANSWLIVGAGVLSWAVVRKRT
jgi:hypothetical protein